MVIALAYFWKIVFGRHRLDIRYLLENQNIDSSLLCACWSLALALV